MTSHVAISSQVASCQDQFKGHPMPDRPEKPATVKADQLTFGSNTYSV